MYRLIGFIVAIWYAPPRRDERGLSQSTENALLVAGGITVATLVVTIVTGFVKAKLPHP